jgi:hypothetical protein
MRIQGKHWVADRNNQAPATLPLAPEKFFRRALPKIWTAAATFRPNFKSGLLCAKRGSGRMTSLFIDVALFSCVFAFVTGIVLAAANFLI